MIKSRYNSKILFTEKELQCPVTYTVILGEGFVDNLRSLREIYGQPMFVTSCCRSKQHNIHIGGHPRSLHVYDAPNHGATGTMAIDIKTPDGLAAVRLLREALSLGWSVGIAKTFFHLDRRVDLGMEQRPFGYG